MGNYWKIFNPTSFIDVEDDNDDNDDDDDDEAKSSRVGEEIPQWC